MGFKSFRAAASVLAGIELMHMIRKRQLEISGSERMSFADLFYAWRYKSVRRKDSGAFRGLNSTARCERNRTEIQTPHMEIMFLIPSVYYF